MVAGTVHRPPHGTPAGGLPRLVIAAPASGHGKTTVATGLMAALARAGHVVSGHKVGPDYIDPGYHALATGRPGRNLDPHLLGEERLAPMLAHGAGAGRDVGPSAATNTGGGAGPWATSNADLAIIEGVMGLHDGQIGGDGFASTAHVAQVTASPVVLVVDVSHASRSIAAVVHGMVTFDSSVRVVGVILNKVGSQRHADEVCRAMEQTGVPILGVLFRDDAVVAPSRHLGLVPADEREDAAQSLDRLAHSIARTVDLERIVALARTAPALDAEPWQPPSPDSSAPHGDRPLVAVAGGRAFTFRYTETTEMLTALGCDVAVFDPLQDEALPEGTRALYLGGGFPEVHAAGLLANEPLRASLATAVSAGLPTYAECAGLLYLCRSVDGAPMVGALEATATMTPRLTLAYRSWVAPQDTLVAAAGTRVTGHEFHRTVVDPAAGAEPAWTGPQGPAGFAGGSLHASYLHTHWAGHPQMARRFAAAARAFPGLPEGPRRRRGLAPPSTPQSSVLGGTPTPHWTTENPAQSMASVTPTRWLSSRSELGVPPASAASGGGTSGAPAYRNHAAPASSPDLTWHGDREVTDGLVDVAVNTFDGPRPGWLEDALRDADPTHYPDPSAAESALARRHGRRVEEVLATAGAAEAFTLIAGLRPWRCPVVVHPQFTEPDVALQRAGHDVHHVLCDPGAHFALESDRVPEEADLVVVGNPTNPTGVLHPAESVRALRRPGRIVVVDEAFMDGLAGEPESLAEVSQPGLVVVRSLTKLWSVPGVRAGYVLADPDVVAALRARQTPWSVGAQAIAAMLACSSEQARAETATRATTLVRNRAVLTDGLTELGVPHVPGPAPFVLARLGPGAHERLREAGFAVRRADTFPGLDESWVRISVRRPDVTRRLLAALHTSSLGIGLS
ncbi:cobyrinate a,c-diamide synthase [Aeromicrobium sp. CTD01-1L150]|uniref:cobyrinate a,c-diamide synthase n=1 Tax=Aeromicrobium sp. CTD01-1L150 TaxID=3341830 RepID=UPI0035BF28A1